MEIERQRFVEQFNFTLNNRVSGNAVREIYGKDYDSFQQAFLVLSGLPEKPSTLETFNRHLAEQNAYAEYHGPDDVYIIKRMSPNSNPHPIRSQKEQEHPAPPASGAI